MKNAETKENSQRRPNNNNVVIKHSQGYLVPSQGLWASLIAQLVKNLSAMQKILVQFLGREDPLEKG